MIRPGAPGGATKRSPAGRRTRLRLLAVALPLLPIGLGVTAGVVAASSDAPVADTGADGELVAAGGELFRTQCAQCHGLDGMGVDGRGPTLEHEGEASADFVLRTGRMPLATPGTQASRGPVRYDEDQIRALVAYVGSIGDGPAIPEVDVAAGDVAVGGELYRLNCAACHVASGAGAPIGAGRVAPSLHPSTPTQIGEAIVVGPGAMPVFDTLEQQDIDDIAAYVRVALQEEDTNSASRFGGAGPVAEGLAAWLLALIPLVALTRWIGAPKEGRDRTLDDVDLADLDGPDDEHDEHDDRNDAEREVAT